MLILKEMEVCPFASSCQYNRHGECSGAKPNRKNEFACEYVVNGKIVEGGSRIPGDKTGKMKLILD